MSITSSKEYGFTLLEMIVSLGIVMLLAAFAVPSFMPLRDQAAMEHLAIEFRGDVMNARHSAVRLSTDVYIHTINLTSTPTQTDNWCLVVSTSATENDCDGSNETLSILQGSRYRGLTISRHPTRSSIRFTPLQGFPDFYPGNVSIELLNFHLTPAKPMTAKVMFNGKGRVCGEGGAWYGETTCGGSKNR